MQFTSSNWWRRLRHFREINRKNAIIICRRPFRMGAETILPFISTIILVIMRHMSSSEFNSVCHIRPQSLPSMGFNSYLTSTLCSFNSSCHKDDQSSKFNLDSTFFADPDLMNLILEISNLRPEQINPFMEKPFKDYLMSSKIPQLINQTASYLNSSTVKLLLNSKLKRIPYFDLIDPNCTPEKINLYLEYPASANDSEISMANKELCSLTINNRTQLIKIYFEHLNILQKSIWLLPLVGIYNQIQKLKKKLEPYDQIFNQVDMYNLTIADIPKFAGLTNILCGTSYAQDNDLGAFLLNLPEFIKKLEKMKKDEKTNANDTTSEEKKISVCDQIENLKRFSPLIQRLDGLLISRMAIFPDSKFTRILGSQIFQLSEKIYNIGKFIDNWNSTYKFIFVNWIENDLLTVRYLLKSCIDDKSINATQAELCYKLFNFLSPHSQNNTQFNYENVTNFITQLGDSVNPYIKCITPEDRRSVYFDDLVPFETFIRNETNTVGVQLDVKSDGDISVMQLRYPDGTIDDTTNFKVLDKWWSPKPRAQASNDEKYITSGFIDLQEQLERVLLDKYWRNHSSLLSFSSKEKLYHKFGTKIQMTPMPCYLNDSMINSLSTQIPMLMMMAWLVTFLCSLHTIIQEKEMRLKEFLRNIGVINSIQWVCWFIRFFGVALLPAIISVLALRYGKVLIISNSFVIFLYISTYLFTIISQSFLISTLFNKSNLGMAFGFFYYFLLQTPFTALQKDRFSLASKYALCLLPQTAYSLGWKKIGTLEVQGFGVQWSDLTYSRELDSDPSFGIIIIFLVLDGIIHLLLTWYIEEVFPGKYGIPRKFYFPFQKSYWTGIFGKEYLDNGLLTRRSSLISENQDPNFESEPQYFKIGVSVRNLHKEYKRSGQIFTAVNNLSINFYSNQITSFLGQNGAGKTTTISLLTGMFPATSGSAKILGLDIRTQMNEIHDLIGFCPQHNVLFNDLTVEEHLHFVVMIKNSKVEKKEINKELESIIKILNLEEKMKTKTVNLSGGQKRKLCVAMAFMGLTKVIFLDEPTAGIDPFARRLIWRLILKKKNDRTIILTTHHMDEADILGDRIAILNEGTLKAIGSSLFMKSRFGKGLRIIFERDPEIKLDPKESLILQQQLLEFIKSYYKLAIIDEIKPTKIEARLPIETNCKEIYKLFSAMETDNSELIKLKQALGIKSFGISDSSLEEIFVDLTLKNKDQEISNCKNSEQSLKSSENSDTRIFYLKSDEKISISRRNTTQLSAMFLKRFNHSKRSRKEWVFALIFPILIVILTLMVTKLIVEIINNPPMPIHPWLMRNKSETRSLYLFTCDNSMNDPLLMSLYKMTKSQYGFTGTRCLPSKYVIPFHRDLKCYLPNEIYQQQQPLNDEYEIKRLAEIQCDCSATGFQMCPSNATGPYSPPEMKLASTDVLTDLTHYNISDYLLKTEYETIGLRYGGIEFVRTENYNLLERFQQDNISQKIEYLFTTLLGTNNTMNLITTLINSYINILPPGRYVKLWYNNKGYVASVAYLNTLHNMLLRNLTNSLNIRPNETAIVTVNHPYLPVTGINQMEISEQEFGLMLSSTIGTLLAFSLLPATILYFIVAERDSGSKHLQRISGLRLSVFWLANCIWDFLTFILVTMVIIVVFKAFNCLEFVSSENVGCFFILLTMFGLAIVPAMYTISFLFSSSSSAFVLAVISNVMLGTITCTFVLYCYLKNLTTLYNLFSKLFLILPQFCLSFALLNLIERHTFQLIESRLGLYGFSLQRNIPGPFESISDQLIALLVHIFVNWAHIYLIEHGYFISNNRKIQSFFNSLAMTRLKHKWTNQINPQCFQVNEIANTENTKSGVLHEETRAKKFCDDLLQLEVSSSESIRRKIPPLVVINMSKKYPGERKFAFDKLNLVVEPGECFGLLGVNGAGKTTTFKILTGQLKMTSGDAYICGHSIRKNYDEIQRKIGYCPQFDALFDFLTGREILYLYAQIKCFGSQVIDKLIDNQINNFDLTQHANKITSQYSGGNKRKLSAAIAFLGDPLLVFLDEPTAGMDPGAKRFLWSRIREAVDCGRSVVMTSHCMEECENLCTRLTIMVRGEMQCIGSVQALKSRYSQGYSVCMRTKDISEVSMIENKLAEELNGFAIRSHNRNIQVKFSKETRLEKIFKFLEKLKSQEAINDYSVNQTTLEDIFLDLAKKDVDHEQIQLV